ncbi:hypothetical protein L1987_64399 [Smallanthus sonchifolius]|uniref:Uncharacterized protein n=1 Tax=Smallanthus sonchifolius TaxID=185202 RepID=A0ACB9CFY8_9ASTR|nr:hypothetical protein L1987_64399 [Smallanthus sonchifolius]
MVGVVPEAEMVGVAGPMRAKSIVEEQPFTFEPEVRAALAREFTELMKTSLPGLLAEALKKANGEASHWWEGVQQAKRDTAVDSMLWNDLKALVIKKFCPRNEIKKVEREFLNLKAGTTGQARTFIKANTPTTFDSVVELSGVVYDDLALNDVVIEEPKKKPSFSNKRTGGKMFGARDKRARVDEPTICKKCGKKHAGECRLGSNLCFKCGKTVTTPVSAHNTSNAITVGMSVI